MKFGRACEILARNHRTSTPHRSETHGVAERNVRRGKEGLTLWNAVAICEMSKTSWQKIWRTIQRANDIFWSDDYLWIHFPR